MAFKALREISWSGVKYAAGESIPVSGRIAEELVRRGDAAKVADPTGPKRPAVDKQKDAPADKQQRGHRSK